MTAANIYLVLFLAMHYAKCFSGIISFSLNNNRPKVNFITDEEIKTWKLRSCNLVSIKIWV